MDTMQPAVAGRTHLLHHPSATEACCTAGAVAVEVYIFDGGDGRHVVLTAFFL